MELNNGGDLYAICRRLNAFYEEENISVIYAMDGTLLDEYRSIINTDLERVASIESKIRNLMP